MNLTNYQIGLDVGSTTAKVVVIDSEGKKIYTSYKRHNTEIFNTIILILEEVLEELGNVNVSVVVTGSAGLGVHEKLGISFIQEVVASAEVVKQKYPMVKTLIDLGGEDAKMIFFNNGKSPDMRMNGNCAGGTGAFIDQMATLINQNVSELNNLAKNHKHIYPIASRCGVFAKTDIQNLISRKISNEDISASIFHAVAIQGINTLARGFEVESKIMFTGGPFSFIPELRKTFMKVLKISDEDIILPDNPELIPAEGAAIIKNIKKYDSSLIDLIIKFKNFKHEDCIIINRLQPLFDDEDDFFKWTTSKKDNIIPKIDFENFKGDNCYLGIDSGSTTIKIVIINDKKEIVTTFYRNNNGNPLDTIKNCLIELKQILDEKNIKINLLQTAVTGYGEDLVKAALGIDIGIVETIAHYTAAKNFDEDVSFILDIGGQDMKAIYIKNGEINNIEINEACSSGCGSFIENFANSLNYPVAEFARLACFAKNPCELGTRCTVFMNSKVKQSLREGATVEDISAGLSYSVIKNCLYKVLKIKDISVLGQNIFVQGGTFRNPSILRALELMLGKDVTCTNIPELMGAYGAAIAALEKYKETKNKSNFISFDKLEEISDYSTKFSYCKGCENNCTITKFLFSNGQSYFSGNKCENVFTNKGEKTYKGVNILDFKYNLIFEKDINSPNQAKINIGIPRVLNFFENFPFWNTLFTECGFNVELSANSTMSLYEKGLGTLMSDNICFPAKLVHGHITDLIEKKVDRIFYPLVMFEKMEDKDAANSFNCPIVSGYPDVIRSSVNFKDIPFDTPVIVFNDDYLLSKACFQYLEQLGISKSTFKKAFKKAKEKTVIVKQQIIAKTKEIITEAEKENRTVIMLAGRPYHIDPLINHKICDILTDLGVDVITEDSIEADNYESIADLQVLTQWSYPNRIYRAAQWVSNQKSNIQFVQLNSFGCGPDAVVVDESSEILREKGKNHTVIKIDEITSTGSVKLRLRSLIESLKLKKNSANNRFVKRRTTRSYLKTDLNKTIIIPHFADPYSVFLPTIFGIMGYKNFVNLPKPDKTSVEIGLKYANNEICYPATIVIGDVIKALQSGDYDLENTAVGISQTGGQCRASSYMSMLKKAMVTSGFDKIPVVSVTTGDDLKNNQPGFKLNWKKGISISFVAALYADSLSKMYYSTVVRERQKGTSKIIFDRYVNEVQQYIETKNIKAIHSLLEKAVKEFNAVSVKDGFYPRIGIVGEIYVKYNDFANHNVVNWLINEGIEVVVPPILDFFTQYFVNNRVNKLHNVRRGGISDIIAYFLERYAKKLTAEIEQIMLKFRYNRPFHDIDHVAKEAERIIHLVNQFGEGWLIPAEIGAFAEENIKQVISLQPFGCIANHIISKGIEKRIKDIYPDMNLLFLDYDASSSEVNLVNRLHFIISIAKEEHKNTEIKEKNSIKYTVEN